MRLRLAMLLLLPAAVRGQDADALVRELLPHLRITAGAWLKAAQDASATRPSLNVLIRDLRTNPVPGLPSIGEVAGVTISILPQGGSSVRMTGHMAAGVLVSPPRCLAIQVWNHETFCVTLPSAGCGGICSV